MHAYIIEGGSQKERDLAIMDMLSRSEVATSETHVMDPAEGSIGIELIQQQIHWLSLRPIASRRNALVIAHANRLTSQAQHALLKTLEEPPEHTLILLGISDTSLLLQTITSRCQVIRIKPEPSTDTKHSLVDDLHLLNGVSWGTCIASNTIQSKEEVMDYLALLESDIANRLNDTRLSYAKYGLCVHLYKGLISLRRALSQNVNPKLALDCFFLTLSFER